MPSLDGTRNAVHDYCNRKQRVAIQVGAKCFNRAAYIFREVITQLNGLPALLKLSALSDNRRSAKCPGLSFVVLLYRIPDALRIKNTDAMCCSNISDARCCISA